MGARWLSRARSYLSTWGVVCPMHARMKPSVVECVFILADRFAVAVLVLAGQGAVQRTLELVGGAAKGLVEAGRMLRHGHRLAARYARFHRAALVATAALVVVLVAQVDLDARHVGRETVQRLPDLLVGPAFEGVLVLDAVAGVHLNLHVIYLWFV